MFVPRSPVLAASTYLTLLYLIHRHDFGHPDVLTDDTQPDFPSSPHDVFRRLCNCNSIQYQLFTEMQPVRQTGQLAEAVCKVQKHFVLRSSLSDRALEGS